MNKLELINSTRTVYVDDLHYPEVSRYEWGDYHDPYLDQSFVCCDLAKGRQVFLEHYLEGLEDLQDDGDQYFTIAGQDLSFIPHVPHKHYDLALGSTSTIKVSSHFGPVMHITLPQWYAMYRHGLEKGWIGDPDGIVSRYEDGKISDKDLWTYVKDNFNDMGAISSQIIKMYKAYLLNRLNEPKSMEIQLVNCDRKITVDRENYPAFAQFDWYEYHDPYLDQMFVACDTPGGRRVLMENVIAVVDTLDDDEWQDLGGIIEVNDMTFLPEIEVKKYHIRFLPLYWPTFQISSDFGPTMHLSYLPEKFKIWENDGVLDDDSWDKIRENCVWRYKQFLKSLNQHLSEGNHSDQMRA